MAKVHFVKKARKNIYAKGVEVKKIHKAGKNKGEEYIGYDKSQPNPDGDTLLVEKGKSYYWWQFAFSPKQFSLTSPKRSRLTRSGFLGHIYDLEDNFSFDQNDFEGSIEELKYQLEDLRDECQNSLDNMPDHLQDTSSAGEILTERIDSLDQWIGDLDSVDLTIDEDEIKDRANEEFVNQPVLETEEDKDSLETEDEIYQRLLQERKDEIEQELEASNPGDF